MVREQIVVGTPGIVLDWILKKRALDPRNIVLLVVDDVDTVKTQGYQDQIVRMSKWADLCTLRQTHRHTSSPHLALPASFRTLNNDCQRTLLLANYDADVEKLARIITPNAVICQE